MRLLPAFKNLPIRHKLLYSYTSVFVLVIVLSGLVAFSILRKTVEANIESELKNSTDAMLNMVRTSVSVAIKNHLLPRVFTCFIYSLVCDVVGTLPDKWRRKMRKPET